jgi:glycosyltransferase involved in cell wall biosynthesis
LVGWALGRDVPVVGVEVLHEGAVIRRTPLGEHRPDLATAFPEHPDAARAGFRTTVPVVGTTAAVDLQVQVVLADHTRAPLAAVHARRGWRTPTPDDPATALVSVVIPCYNQAHFLAEALDSVLAQTHPQIEVVVVDDGSTDNTSAVAAAYPGVRCIRQPNRGLAAARNTGLRHTTGDYLVFLDADDRLLPHAITTGLRELANHPDAAFVFGHYRHIGLAGEPLPTPVLEVVASDVYPTLLRYNCTGMPATAMYRREVFEHVKGFRKAPTGCEDYDLNLRIAGDFSVHGHGNLVAEYRRHGASMAQDYALMLRGAMAALTTQRPVASSRSLKKNYRAGLQFWRSYYGEPLVEQVRGQLEEGAWQQALRALPPLMRHYPRGLLSLLRRPSLPR